MILGRLAALVVGKSRFSAKAWTTTTAPEQHRTPLGLFTDTPVPRLYDRLVEALRVCRYSGRTEEACLHWIRQHIEFPERRHPRQLAQGDLNGAPSRLPVTYRLAAATQKQALSPILFLDEPVLEKSLDRIEAVVRDRWPKP